jgi:hypothetical protein
MNLKKIMISLGLCSLSFTTTVNATEPVEEIKEIKINKPVPNSLRTDSWINYKEADRSQEQFVKKNEDILITTKNNLINSKSIKKIINHEIKDPTKEIIGNIIEYNLTISYKLFDKTTKLDLSSTIRNKEELLIFYETALNQAKDLTKDSDYVKLNLVLRALDKKENIETYQQITTIYLNNNTKNVKTAINFIQFKNSPI